VAVQEDAGVPTSNIRQVAKAAGVSVGTVSNVLNRPGVVAAATRARVLEAIRDLEFVPNSSARSLRSGSARTLGLVVFDLSNPFFTDLARGVEDAARAAGLSVVVCSTDEDTNREAEYLDLLEEQRVRGVVVVPAGPRTDALQSLREAGIAVVRVDHRGRTDDECTVGTDDVLGGRLAGRHLVDVGHRRIAYVGGGAGVWAVNERRVGAGQVLTEAGLGEDALADLWIPALTFAYGRDAGERLLGLSPRPTAVFCANDLVALGILQIMTERGVRVPDDLAIVGYDDIEFAGAAAVPLTSVRQPRRLLGRTAANMVIEESDGSREHVHRHEVFNPELVVRASTGGGAARRTPS
jgi:LacI family transcriptional regulator, galactose operon repressor